MTRIFHWIFCLSLSLNLSAQETFLMVNPSGHKGQIRDITLETNGQYFLTASFDKTIKRWRVKDGQLIRTFHGYIQPGAQGQYYAQDISPDGRLLACGGWMGDENTATLLGQLRIFDVMTGVMVDCPMLAENVIKAVDFQDDQTVVIGDGYGTVKSYRTDKKLAMVLYDGPQHSIQSLSSKDKKLAAADVMGNVFIWNKGKPELQHQFQIPEGRYIEQVQWHPTQPYLIVSASEKLYIYTDKFKLVNEYEMTKGWFRFDISKDGSQVVFTCPMGTYDPSNDLQPKNGELVVVQAFQKGNISGDYTCSYSGHNDHVLDVAFVNNNEVISASIDHSDIIKWTCDKAERQRYQFKVSSEGSDLHSAYFDGKHISYAIEADAEIEEQQDQETPPTHHFEIYTKEFGQDAENLDYKQPIRKRGNLSLKEIAIGEPPYDAKAIQINYGGYPKDTISFSPVDGFEVSSFGLTPSSQIIAGGAQGVLRAYDHLGKEIARLVGHDGAIMGVSISNDNKYLTTCADDQTIRLWLLEEIYARKSTDRVPSLWESAPYDHQFIKDLRLMGTAQQYTQSAWLRCIKEAEKAGHNVDYWKELFNKVISNQVTPYLSFFFTDDEEWIIWNRDGYFMSSKSGAQYVRFHVNQDKCQQAKSYPFEQFDLKYNRPDIILQDLSFFDEQLIEMYELAYQKRLKKLDMTADKLGEDLHAPEVEITTFEHQPKSAQLKLTVKGSDEKYELGHLNVYINDVAVYGRSGKIIKGQSIAENLQLDLMNGENKVQVSVTNKLGAESLKETIEIVQGQMAAPDLYVLAIGAGEFVQSNYNLKYPAKDVKDFLAHFESTGGGKGYAHVHVKQLTGEEVTKDKVLATKSFVEQAKPNDVVMMFVAGHGLLDAEYNYYFATHDIDFANPAGKGLPYEQLEALLDGIPALKKLLFMDTCHSGEIEKDEVETVKKKVSAGELAFRAVGDQTIQPKAGMTRTTALMKEMFVDLRRGTGATVISSAGGVEFALEGDDWNNGLFTYCLLNGLKTGEADENQDGEVVISELKAYVSEKVSELSGGKQQPTSRMENVSNDFRVY